MSHEKLYSPNLAEVFAAETAICDVRGDSGELMYRGHSVTDLIDRPFLDVVELLLGGGRTRDQIEEALNRHSALTEKELSLLSSLPETLHPMAMLQAMVPLIGARRHLTPIADRNISSGFLIAAKLPALIAAWHRFESGLKPIASDASLTINQNFLQMLHGDTPSNRDIRVLNTVQILQLEHSLNISTYVSRIAAGTQASMSAILGAAIATLSGPLHGGADQAALALARELGSPEAAKRKIPTMLKQKRVIMGMGHRDYKTVDPRATVLKPLAASFCKSPESQNLFETLVAIEEECHAFFATKGKSVHANLEFYKGVVMHQLGIPDDCFTAVFTMSRVWGWLAHYLEFQKNPVVIRPAARYVGK